MKNIIQLIVLVTLLFLQFAAISQYREPQKFQYSETAESTIQAMLSLLVGDEEVSKKTLQQFDDNWEEGYLPMLVDVMYLSRGRVDLKPISRLIEKKSGKRYGADVFKWLDWIWSQDQNILPYHGDWLARTHRTIDPKFEKYFLNRTHQSKIRLDEVRWGGVVQDGIPPLRQPAMLKANQADYLEDDNIVFGVSINGDHRAYPKRILAWHEMFVDEIGGESIAGVYCTLCGTVIAYNTKLDGKQYDLGTSGFLYRSNKLMYDKATQSLWNTIEGKPVIGPLSEKNIELNSHAVVTTTWGQWKKLHPDTQVLSLETGHRRNYDEGNAYKDYFSTDRLMFTVPDLDARLLNKDEVLIIRADGYKEDPLAISAKFLALKRVYHNQIGGTNFVVLTDKSGANRVYESKALKFKKQMDGAVKDSDGVLWKIEEEKLSSPSGQILERLPYHRMFWFAWYNTYKDTRLVK